MFMLYLLCCIVSGIICVYNMSFFGMVLYYCAWLFHKKCFVSQKEMDCVLSEHNKPCCSKLGTSDWGLYSSLR